nr:reverse transcriptase domain-containing protein [Tanacetum cinerariifolium]
MKMNTDSSSGSGTLPGNTITNPKEDLKGITTRSGTTYQGPTIPTTSSSLPLVVERETEATKDTVHPTNNGSTKYVQPSVVQTESPISNSEPVVSPIIEPVVAPFSAPKPNQRPLILISINLMPLSVWNKLSLPELFPTCMTFELIDRSISPPVGVAEDVFVKVGTFHFLADIVVVDFDADPRVPLILGRSFLKTRRALIDVFEGELTLRVGKEAITFNLCKIHVKYRSFHSIRAKSPYDNKWAKKAQGKGGLPKPTLAGPPKGSRADPTLLNDFEMAAEGNDDLPVPDLRNIEELCQPSLNGRGRPISSISIQATNFGLKNDMIQQVQNSCQFHGLPPEHQSEWSHR